MGTARLASVEADLLQRARQGDDCAVEALYDAHLGSARRLAVILTGPQRADDLVADAFIRVIGQLKSGGGPETNFRSYLFSAIRNRHRDLLRRGSREQPVSDQPWVFDGECPGADEEAHFDEREALTALHSLPERWQRVLWQLEVQEQPVTELAAELGISPSALTSLAHRARRGLRTAYLHTHPEAS